MMRIRKKMKKKMMRKRRKSWRLVVPQEENIESFLWCMLPHSLSVLVIGIQYFCNVNVSMSKPWTFQYWRLI